MDGLLTNFVWTLLFLDLFFIILIILVSRPRPKDFLIWTLMIIILPIVGMVLYMLFGPMNYDGEFPTEKEIIGEGADEYFSKVNDDIESMNVTGKEAEYALIKGFERFSSVSFSKNNDITVFGNTLDYFESIFADMENAKEFIHIETFIFDNDVLGQRLMEVLFRKLKDGVKIRFMCDYLGFNTNAQPFVEEFKSAGGEFCVFHPLTNHTFSPKKNNRCHRKIAVIDNNIGYIGGANFNRDYIGEGDYGKWSDIDVRVTGGSVTQLNIRFAIDWKYSTGKTIEEECFRDRFSENNGNIPIQLVCGGLDAAEYRATETLIADVISSAKKYVWMQTPYLVPTKKIYDALYKAAESGVDVRIMIPLHSDHKCLVYQNSLSANRLMKKGIKVFKDHGTFLHSKLIIVDGKYCVTGSMNFDRRTACFDFESSIVIYSEDVTKKMEAIFENDMRSCNEYSCEEYRNRCFTDRLRTVMTYFYRSML